MSTRKTPRHISKQNSGEVRFLVNQNRGTSRCFLCSILTSPLTSERFYKGLQRCIEMDCLHLVVKRSEEHTSELQSHLNLVCRLLLEKKKQIARTSSLCCFSCRHDASAVLRCALL